MRRAIGVFLVWTVSMGLVVALVAVATLAYRYWQVPLAEQATTVRIEPSIRRARHCRHG